MVTPYTKLRVAVLSEPTKGIGYRYLVSSLSSAHTAFRVIQPVTAFRRKESFLSWLSDMGLHLEEELPKEEDWADIKIVGSYAENMIIDPAEFDYVITSVIRPVLSNGEYTIGKVTKNNGVRTVHFLNPNCRGRILVNYQYAEENYG